MSVKLFDGNETPDKPNLKSKMPLREGRVFERRSPGQDRSQAFELKPLYSLAAAGGEYSQGFPGL
jgi:hypothetical protein